MTPTKVYIGAAVLFLFTWLFTRQLRAEKGIMNDTIDLPRGIRNNNPGNIRISDIPWQGKVIPNTDKVYEVFDTPENGIRAIYLNLHAYGAQHGISTLQATAERWAPSFENNTQEYVKGLVLSSGIPANSFIDLTDNHQAWTVVRGIIRNENGTNAGLQWYSDDFIKSVGGL